MKNSNWLPHILKILWMVGLMILAILSVTYVNEIQQTANVTFNPIPVIWSKVVISIIFGLYTSLLFLKKRPFHVNVSLLCCVAIPSLILSLAFPIIATASSANHLPEMLTSETLYSILQKIDSSGVFGFIAGLTLILSLIHTHSDVK